jgi:hypothetical protein
MDFRSATFGACLQLDVGTSLLHIVDGRHHRPRTMIKRYTARGSYRASLLSLSVSTHTRLHSSPTANAHRALMPAWTIWMETDIILIMVGMTATAVSASIARTTWMRITRRNPPQSRGSPFQPMNRSNGIAHCVYPGPCGYAGDSIKECTCSPSTVTRYRKRTSEVGPVGQRAAARPTSR